MFLILSTMTALLECGPIFLGIGLGYSPGQTLSFCLAYQAGNLFPVPFYIRVGTLRKSALLSTLLLCFAPFMNASSFLQWGLYFTGILLLSCTTQSIRAEMKTQVSTTRKRLARIAGFLLAPLLAYAPFHLLLLCCLVVLFSLEQCGSYAKTVSTPTPPGKVTLITYAGMAQKSHSLYAVMLWHQLHYFIYAYGVLLYAYQITGNAFLTMLFFACTWLTYLSTEPLAKLLRQTFPKSVAAVSDTSGYITAIRAGHTFLLVILLLLPNLSNELFFFLWILTGFGGGTVFAITALCRYSTTYTREQLVLTENLGHFIGTGFAVIWASVFPQYLPRLSYPAAFCVLTVIVLTFTEKNITTNQKTRRHL